MHKREFQNMGFGFGGLYPSANLQQNPALNSQLYGASPMI